MSASCVLAHFRLIDIMLVISGVGVVALFVSGLVRLVASDRSSPVDRVLVPTANDAKEFENLSSELDELSARCFTIGSRCS